MIPVPCTSCGKKGSGRRAHDGPAGELVRRRRHDLAVTREQVGGLGQGIDDQARHDVWSERVQAELKGGDNAKIAPPPRIAQNRLGFSASDA